MAHRIRDRTVGWQGLLGVVVGGALGRATRRAGLASAVLDSRTTLIPNRSQRPRRGSRASGQPLQHTPVLPCPLPESPPGPSHPYFFWLASDSHILLSSVLPAPSSLPSPSPSFPRHTPPLRARPPTPMRAGPSRSTGPSQPDSRPHRGNPDHDPFAALLQPPPNETEEQRAERLRQEEEARKRSENIDRMLRHDEKSRRRKKTVKVLLLGQSESGKSTTLKRESLSSPLSSYVFDSRPRPYIPRPPRTRRHSWIHPLCLPRHRLSAYKDRWGPVQGSRGWLARHCRGEPVGVWYDTLTTCYSPSPLVLVCAAYTAGHRDRSGFLT